LLFCFSLALTGCSIVTTATPSLDAGVAFQGKVRGGQQPIVGAHVYLFAANTTGYGNASVSLLNASSTGYSDSVGAYVLTASDGSFSVTGDYSCTANTQVYLYALGGNPGAGTNSAAGLLAAVGNCPGTGFPSSAYIWINEVSTVAAAYAMAGFAVDATHVSSSGTALAQVGIANGFLNATNLASLSTGTALATTPAGNGTVPQTTINTLANILAACVNSTGPTSTPCSTLFANALSAGATGTAPTDTATAAINIAHYPAVNVAALYGITAPAVAFAPSLTTQPNDLGIALRFTGGGLSTPDGMAVHGSGNVWVTNDDSRGGVVELSPTGTFLSGVSGYLGGGMEYSDAIAIDLSGNAWIANAYGTADLTGSVTKLSSTGSILSGANGFAGGGIENPSAIAIDGSGNAWVYGDGGAVSKFSPSGVSLAGTTGYVGAAIGTGSGLAIDASGNAWITCINNTTVVEISSAGTVLSVANSFVGGLDDPRGIAVDHSGSIWVANNPPSPPTLGGFSVTKLSSSGTILSGNNGYTGGDLSGPIAVAIDGAGNAWFANSYAYAPTDGYGTTVTELSNAGTVLSGTYGYAANGNLFRMQGVVIDPSGNVWLGDPNDPYTGAVVELVGAATPVVTPLAAGVANNTLGTRP
jgi:hypothetical protein